MKKNLLLATMLITVLAFFACNGGSEKKDEKSKDDTTSVVKEQKALLKDQIVGEWRMISDRREDQSKLKKPDRRIEESVNSSINSAKMIYVFNEDGKMYEEIDGKKVPDMKNVDYKITDKNGKEDFGGNYLYFTYLDFKTKDKDLKTGKWEVLKISDDSLIVRKSRKEYNRIMKFVRYKKVN